MVEILNNISLKTKLIIVYLIMVFILIMTMGFYLSHRLNNASFHSAIRLSNIASEQLQENFENKMSVYYKMVETVKNNPRFIEYINTQFNDEYDSLKYYIDNVENIFNTMEYNDDSMIAKFYSDNNSIRFSRVTNNSLNDLKISGFLNINDLLNLEINWIRPVTINSGEDFKYIGCYKAYHIGNADDRINSVLVLLFKEEQLYSLFTKERENGKKIFIYDNGGKIITSTERNMLGKNIIELGLNGTGNPDTIDNNTLVKFNNNKYLYLKNVLFKPQININDWNIISLVPADKLLADTTKIWVSTFAICILCAILSSLVILFISNNVTIRITNLLDKMEKIKKGDFKVEKSVSGNDEIGVLERDFYDMVNKIDNLINDVYISNLKLKNAKINSQRIEMEKKEAEIIALQGQINPHYLFNTLEAIRMNLLLNGDRKTADIILIFGESFRACFDTQSDFFTIYQEMDFIHNYIKIQKYRYMDKIDCCINIQEHLSGYKIPKLILQPIVENAIYHGLEPKVGKGTIVIEAFEDNRDLYFKVTDDGVGMDTEEMDKLITNIYGNGVLPPNEGSGRIALKNVNKRLRLLYGEEYGLKIISEKNRGTVVEIKVRKTPLNKNRHLA